MKLKDIESLIQMITEADLAEFKMKSEDLEINIRTKHYHKQVQAPIASTPQIVSALSAAPTPDKQPQIKSTEESGEPSADTTEGLLEVKSPIVGTFYRASSPDKPPFVKVGDSIAVGDVVCIVEAMKLFNEIDSEVSGKVVKVLVEDASPVEYDQVLFLVDPAG